MRGYRAGMGPWIARAGVVLTAALLASRYGSPFDYIRDGVFLAVLMSLGKLLPAPTAHEEAKEAAHDAFFASLSNRESGFVLLSMVVGIGVVAAAVLPPLMRIPGPLADEWPWWLAGPLALMIVGGGMGVGQAVATRLIRHRRTRGGGSPA